MVHGAITWESPRYVLVSHGRTESKDKHETKLPIYCGFFYIVILSVLDGGD